MLLFLCIYTKTSWKPMNASQQDLELWQAARSTRWSLDHATSSWRPNSDQQNRTGQSKMILVYQTKTLLRHFGDWYFVYLWGCVLFLDGCGLFQNCDLKRDIPKPTAKTVWKSPVSKKKSFEFDPFLVIGWPYQSSLWRKLKKGPIHRCQNAWWSSYTWDV